VRIRAFLAKPQPKFPKQHKPKKEKYYNTLENKPSLATRQKNQTSKRPEN
jgi:hypothetical protein